MNNKNLLSKKINLLAQSLRRFLHESNPRVVESLLSLGHDRDQVRRIELFDWFQGVGLYGYYRLWSDKGDDKILSVLEEYYRTRIDDSLPAKNINSMAPMLTLLNYALATDNRTYLSIAEEWAEWLYREMPRTRCGAFSHLTCEASNSQELWDDTLFMSVLFLGRAGMAFDRKEYLDDAVEQLFLHAQYLEDRDSGLWYHGWTFDGDHNFVKALWARGNSWITIFIPDFLEIAGDALPTEQKDSITGIYHRQIKPLLEHQDSGGLWNTLIDDPSSYLEASGSAGIAYGLLRGVSQGIVSQKDKAVVISAALKTLDALIPLIDSDGTVHQVSGGTPMGKDSLDFYRNIPLEPKPYGQAMALLALLEGLKVSEKETV